MRPPRPRHVAAALLALSLAPAPGAAESLHRLEAAPDAAAAEAEWHCDDYHRVAVGDFLLSNNVWNKGDIRDYRQCIATRGGGAPLRWRWRWPGGDIVPEAFPAVIFGWKPWLSRSTHPALPVRVDRIRKLDVRHDASIEADGGVYNLALDLWIVSDPPPRPERITTEVMVWLVNRGMRPAGERVGGVTLDGVEWELWDGRIESWRYLAFVHPGPPPERIVVAPLLAHLVEAGRLSGEHWLASVELGTELAGGEGMLTLSTLELRVDAADPPAR